MHGYCVLQVVTRTRRNFQFFCDVLFIITKLYAQKVMIVVQCVDAE
jgi:hypothetical protein